MWLRGQVLRDIWRVGRYVATDVSQDCNSFVWRLQQFCQIALELLNPEDEGTRSFYNSVTFLSVGTAYHTVRFVYTGKLFFFNRHVKPPNLEDQ